VPVFGWDRGGLWVVAFFVGFDAVPTVELGAFEVFSHCSALLLSRF